MKSALKDPFVQGVVCILLAAGLYVASGHVTDPKAHDGLIGAAGAAMTLWVKLPRNSKEEGEK